MHLFTRIQARREAASHRRQNLIEARQELVDARQSFVDSIVEDGEPRTPFLTARDRLDTAHDAAGQAAQALPWWQRIDLDRQHAQRTHQWCLDLHAARRDDTPVTRHSPRAAPERPPWAGQGMSALPPPFVDQRTSGDVPRRDALRPPRRPET